MSQSSVGAGTACAQGSTSTPAPVCAAHRAPSSAAGASGPGEARPAGRLGRWLGAAALLLGSSGATACAEVDPFVGEAIGGGFMGDLFDESEPDVAAPATLADFTGEEVASGSSDLGGSADLDAERTAPAAEAEGSTQGGPETADDASETGSEDFTPALPLAPSGSAPRKPSMLGYNMDYPGDWTNVPPFIDQMKNARAVRGECSSADPGCDERAHLDLDPSGWLRSLSYRDDPSRSYAAAHVIFNTSRERPDIGQTFVVTWRGNADVRVFNGGDVRSAGERRLTFVLQPGNSMLSLRDIDPADPARDIRIFRADHERLLAEGEVFSPEMLEFLAPFGSLRFMDWMQSNSPGRCSGGSETGRECYAVTGDDCGGGGVCTMPGHWAERPTPDQPSQYADGQYLDNERPELGTKVGGYPVETLVALANRVGADPHFNMPADYDDDFVRRFASYVKAHLGPGLRASVEYSNEVWNWGFPQAGYANTLGRELWPDEGSAWVQYAAGRTSNLCRIWKEVFAGEEHRVRCLISPQTDWRELAETVLECPAWRASHPGSGPCYEYVDAINITGYFAGCLHTNPDAVQQWLGRGKAAALDLAFEQLEHGGLIAGCRDNLDYTIDTYGFFRDLAEPRGLDLYVYESGTHFAYDASDETRQFLVDMTRDERMYEAYLRNFRGFQAAGGSLLNVWGWVAKNDAWANSESVLELDHPKYRAISDFASAGAR